VNSQFAFEAAVSVATPLVLGPGSHGLRRVVPITGGTVKGPRLTGRVVPGGADWQSEYYFRTIAEFEAPTERAYAWLNRSVFVGVAERTASAAIIRFYEVL
jgi:hypothetical protein